MRPLGIIFIALCLAWMSLGCKKQSPEPPAAPAPPPPAAVAPAPPTYETLARIHWVGKKRLFADPKATNLVGVWSMPESEKLLLQSLDKLAAAPWRFLTGAPGADTNAATALLRPLLDDLVNEECWLDLRRLSNAPAEIRLALRLDPDRGVFWRSNLAACLEGFTGVKCITGAKGWSLESTNTPKFIELAEARGWTVLGLAAGQGPLVSELLLYLEKEGLPFQAATTNAFLEVDLDAAKSAEALDMGGWVGSMPHVSLAFTPQGESVRTSGDLFFSSPLSLNLEPWQVPTNIIHQPLVAFTALRGFGPLLSQLSLWERADAGPPPNQAFLWSLKGLPFLTYFIAPLVDSSNAVLRASEYLMRKAKPWMASNAMGTLQLSSNPVVLAWADLPMIKPYMANIQSNGIGYVFSGVIPALPLGNPFPLELVQEMARHSNLVCYDWELTSERLEAALNVGQLLRFSFRKPQLEVDSAPMRFLKVVGPKLGNCATAITHTAPNQLSLLRKSGLGMSALELHFICDWLQSPDFPVGLHTTRATNIFVIPQRPSPRSLQEDSASRSGGLNEQHTK